MVHRDWMRRYRERSSVRRPRRPTGDRGSFRHVGPAARLLRGGVLITPHRRREKARERALPNRMPNPSPSDHRGTKKSLPDLEEARFKVRSPPLSGGGSFFFPRLLSLDRRSRILREAHAPFCGFSPPSGLAVLDQTASPSSPAISGPPYPRHRSRFAPLPFVTVSAAAGRPRRSLHRGDNRRLGNRKGKGRQRLQLETMSTQPYNETSERRGNDRGRR